ncbi:MAG: DinB family protein [Caldilineaceae bacterium]
MTHPLVTQLRFTRSEWLRALDGVTEDEAQQRFAPMNSIGWIVGHLSWQEQRYWLTFTQNQTPLPELNELVGYGRSACTPSLTEMLSAWDTIARHLPLLVSYRRNHGHPPAVGTHCPTRFCR